MAYILSSEKLKLIEEIIGDREKARKVAEVIDETVEIRQELKQKIESVRQEPKQEIKLVRQEIEIVRQELKGDIRVLKVLIYALFVFVALLNRGTVEFIFKVLGILK